MSQKRFTSEKLIGMLKEAKVLIENWRQEYNTVSPHSSLHNRPPAPEAVLPWGLQPPGLQSKSSQTASILS